MVRYSVLVLSDHQELGEGLLVFSLHVLGEDLFNFPDESGSLLVNDGIQVLIDDLVRVADLSDDEIQEDEGCVNNHDQPDDPEHDVLLHIQVKLGVLMLVKQVEAEVAQGEPHDVEEVTPELRDVPVLTGLIDRDDVEDHGAEKRHQGEEYQEHSDVRHNLENHCHDVAELLDHLQELKHLVERHKHLQNGRNLTLG